MIIYKSKKRVYFFIVFMGKKLYKKLFIILINSPSFFIIFQY